MCHEFVGKLLVRTPRLAITNIDHPEAVRLTGETEPMRIGGAPLDVPPVRNITRHRTESFPLPGLLIDEDNVRPRSRFTGRLSGGNVTPVATFIESMVNARNRADRSLTGNDF